MRKVCPCCELPFVTEANQRKYCEGCTQSRAIKHHLRKWGISRPKLEQMLREQGGGCAICQKPLDLSKGKKGGAALDHDHVTGKARGILCMRCNTFLAAVENKPWLSGALDYLEKHT